MIHDMTFEAYGRTISLARLKAGEGVPLHRHEGEHTLYIAEGQVLILGINREYGPDNAIVFQAGDEHGFTAVTDALIVSTFVTSEFPLLAAN
jgi:quercetin dioxygenase-like cupin family protein